MGLGLRVEKFIAGNGKCLFPPSYSHTFQLQCINSIIRRFHLREEEECATIFNIMKSSKRQRKSADSLQVELILSIILKVARTICA